MRRGFLVSGSKHGKTDSVPLAKPPPTPTRNVQIPTGPAIPPDNSPFTGNYLPAKGDTASVNVNILTLPQNTTEPVAITLLFPGARDAILTYPGFPAPIVRTPLPPRFTFEQIPGKGMGTFATTNLQPGDLISSERPLIVFPAGMWWSETWDQSTHPDHILEKVVNQLCPGSLRMFYALHNCKTPRTGSDTEKIRGICDTNAIDIGALPGHNGRYFAICPCSSHLNHSCTPNAYLRWDFLSFTEQAVAIRPILAGEEITFNYMSLSLSRAERQSRLLGYSFTCTCETCSLPPRESRLSDIRRSVIQSVEHDADDESALREWLADPSLPDDHIIKQSKRIAEMMEQEQIYLEDVWPAHYQRLCKAYCALGDAENARVWAKKAAVMTRIVKGSDDGGWGEVVAAPQNTTWWRLRAERVQRVSKEAVDATS